MFSYTGLNEAQVKSLIDKHHIHLIKNGRISMAGINTKNVEYIAQAIKDVVVNVKWSFTSILFKSIIFNYLV